MGYNSISMDDFSGLTPNEMHELLYYPFERGSPVGFSPKKTMVELYDKYFLTNTSRQELQSFFLDFNSGTYTVYHRFNPAFRENILEENYFPLKAVIVFPMPAKMNEKHALENFSILSGSFSFSSSFHFPKT